MLAPSGVHVRSMISGACIWERNVRVKSPAGVCFDSSFRVLIF